LTEQQLPLFILIAFLGGCFAGAWTGKSRLAAGILLIAAILLDTTGWAVYGFAVNWQPSWGIKNIVGGLLYNGIGMVLYATAPAVAGFGLTLFVVRRLLRRPKHVAGA
jgi:hypothetical protein